MHVGGDSTGGSLPCARRYVTGDFRFRAGYSRSNPRKMVKMWAEKEFRNLARLRAAGDDDGWGTWLCHVYMAGLAWLHGRLVGARITVTTLIGGA